jgi:hypothetical protein
MSHEFLIKQSYPFVNKLNQVTCLAANLLLGNTPVESIPNLKMQAAALSLSIFFFLTTVTLVQLHVTPHRAWFRSRQRLLEGGFGSNAEA